jgi:hypothetical protein
VTGAVVGNDYVVGTKYALSDLSGNPVPSALPTITYEFGTKVGGTLLYTSIDSIAVKPKSAAAPAPAAPSALPRENRVRQNYSNPFNPDTWIPFELAEDASVRIEIYDVTGRLVRTLDLGHRPAGYYLEKSKAAYWDGRNDVGESVSSGIYFYKFSAGDFSAIKRMVILK